MLVLTHSHAEDFELIDACLQRLRAQDDLPFVGLIGSRTKWGSFRSRLLARGHPPSLLARVVCPIGLPGIPGKASGIHGCPVGHFSTRVSKNGKPGDRLRLRFVAMNGRDAAFAPVVCYLPARIRWF